MVTSQQICSLGVTHAAVSARVAAARLHRLYRGVYALVPRQLLQPEGHLLAAVLACGPHAALSHRSAAAILGLRATSQTKVDVTIPGRTSRQHRGIRVHRSTTLTSRDVTKVRNIPCTTVARTLLDLAEVVSRRGLERAFDQADILEVLDLTALNDQLSRNHTRRAATRVQSVLTEHYIGSTPTWSDLEEAFLAMTRVAGIPDPEVNVWIDPGDGEPAIRADFVWRAQRLVVETDGHKTHRTRQAIESNRRSDQRLIAGGWRPVRMTWKQIQSEPVRLSALINRLLGR